MKKNFNMGQFEFGVFLRKRKNPRNKVATFEDLGYELRQLLGAEKIIQEIAQWDGQKSSDDEKFGNLANYFKDSAYLHIRNIMNALTNQYIVDGQAVPSIKSNLYGTWKPAIEKFALHITTTRNQKGVSNTINGKHLNDLVSNLTNEVKLCWQEWADNVGDAALEQKIEQIMAEGESCAQSDVDRLAKLINDSRQNLA